MAAVMKAVMGGVSSCCHGSVSDELAIFVDEVEESYSQCKLRNLVTATGRSHHHEHDHEYGSPNASCPTNELPHHVCR